MRAHIQDIYGICVSDSTVSRITDKILPSCGSGSNGRWRGSTAVVFLDAIHYHVRSEGQIVKKAVYIAIGIDLNGRKDVLGMWGRRKRERQILGDCTQWSEEPWRRGHFHRLHGQLDGI